MNVRARLSVCTAALATLLAPAAWAQGTTQFRGTIGQQKVTLSIQFEGDAVLTAHYRYESQKSDVPVTESKLFGTTVILADDDGNVFHLHLRRADGVATTEVKEAALMDGIMNREDLDLPVKMERVKP